MSALLDIRGLRAGYGRTPVLHGVDLTVAPGAIVGVLGHNGMGKTTLLKAIMGIVPAAADAMRLAGRDLSGLGTDARARLGMGYVPQGGGIFPNLSVRDNIRMGVAAHGHDEQDSLRRAMREFPRLEPVLDRMGSALSGGERQLLALARCLVSEPRLMLLDEPTEGLQPSIVDEIAECLRDFNRRRGLSMVLVEHNLDFITELSDRVLLMQKGAIAREVQKADAQLSALIDAFAGFGAGAA